MADSWSGRFGSRGAHRATGAMLTSAACLWLAPPAAAFEYSCVFSERYGAGIEGTMQIDERVSIRERTPVLAVVRTSTEINDAEIVLGARMITILEMFVQGGSIVTTVPIGGGLSIRTVQRLEATDTFVAHLDRGTCEASG